MSLLLGLIGCPSTPVTATPVAPVEHAPVVASDCRLATEESTDSQGPIRSIAYTYDAAGQLVRADARDHRRMRHQDYTITYTWDDAGRPLSVERDDAYYPERTAWTWTGGYLTSRVHETGYDICNERFTRDAGGRELRHDQRGSGCYPGWDEISTWVDGLLVGKQMTEPAAGEDRLLFEETYAYDARGRLVHRELTGTPGLEWWDADYYTWDDEDRVRTHAWERDGVISWMDAYTWSPDGVVVLEHDQGADGVVDLETTSDYAYGRLVREETRITSDIYADDRYPPGEGWHTWTYDDDGRLLEERRGSLGDTSTSWIDRYRYDQNGNLVHFDGHDPGWRDYTWDCRR
jgi:YD repeat-containing protein